MSTKYCSIQEDLGRHAHPLPQLPVGPVVQVQNQRGKDPLRWNRSGIVVESLENQQYTVKMDGSGRVSLRNRKFLRKIQPLVPRYVSLDDLLVTHQGVGEKQVSVNKNVGENDDVNR